LVIILALLCAKIGRAQLTSRWIGGDGSWTDSTNWSNGKVPTTTPTVRNNVLIAEQSDEATLDSGEAFTIHALNLERGTLRLENGSRLTVHSINGPQLPADEVLIEVAGTGTQLDSMQFFDITIGRRGQITLEVTAGGRFATDGYLRLGNYLPDLPASEIEDTQSKLLVSGPGSRVDISRGLIVGASGGVGALVVENGGKVELSGIVRENVRIGEFTGAGNRGNGSVVIQGLGSELRAPAMQIGDFGSAGDLTLKEGGRVFLYGEGPLNSTTGIIRMQGGELEALTGVRNMGVTQGWGNIKADLANFGDLLAGAREPLTIQGDFEQLSSGDVAFSLAEGSTLVTKLTVAGQAKLAGTLSINLVDGFEPPVGTIHHVMDYASREGKFSKVNTAFGTNGLVMLPIYSNQGIDLFSVLSGDANFDQSVGLTDFGILKAGFGRAGTWTTGDFDHNEMVDLSDFGLLKHAFGNTARSVPEPPTWLLMLVGLIASRLAHKRCSLTVA
jgi:T5SS/PEP-CTERM-associated repeat protein